MPQTHHSWPCLHRTGHCESQGLLRVKKFLSLDFVGGFLLNPTNTRGGTSSQPVSCSYQAQPSTLLGSIRQIPLCRFTRHLLPSTDAPRGLLPCSHKATSWAGYPPIKTEVLHIPSRPVVLGTWPKESSRGEIGGLARFACAAFIPLSQQQGLTFINPLAA